jgi:hypothetical protein
VAIVVVAAALCVIGLGIIAAYFLSTSKDDHA